MVLNINNIRDLSDHEIFNFIKTQIDKIYQRYIYLNMPINDYYEIVLSEIKISKIEYKGEVSYSVYIGNKIKNNMKKETRRLLNNSKTSYEIINNYINCKFVLDGNSEKQLKQLSNFLKDYNCVLNVNLIRQLLNNNIAFNKTVEIVYKKYSQEIERGNIDGLFSSRTIANIIVSYCKINKIDIEYQDEEMELDNDYYEDSLTQYLNEISKYELMNKDEERELGIRVANGSEEAREEFIKRNLKLVVAVAKGYKNVNISLKELIAYGNIGLISAVDRFDATKGCRFSTFAVDWIKKEIITGINNSIRDITLSNYKSYELVGFIKKVQQLQKELNRKPSLKEICDLTGYSEEKVNELFMLSNSVVSLNEAGDEEGKELGDYLESFDEPLDDQIIKSELGNQIQKLLEEAGLTEKEKQVLMYHFGLKSCKKLTLDQIRKMMSITREGVRLIEIRALAKLRRSGYIKNLIVYTDNPDRPLSYYGEFDGKRDFSSKPANNFSKVKRNKEEKASVEVILPKDIIKYDIITDDDYDKLIDLINNPKMQKVLNILSVREVSFFLLNMGYINDKAFSISAIANYFKVSEEEVGLTIKKLLIRYKYYLLSALSYLENNELIRKRLI